jgi:HAD superfamily phosphoserine phosphatase-like hydrolase
MRLVIFDIDSTLVTGPSTERRFFLHLLRTRKLGLRQGAAYILGLIRWTPRFGRAVLQKNKAYLSGLDVNEIAMLAKKWAETRLASAWYEPALKRLRQHQEAGDRVVLMSGTPSFVAEAIGARLDVRRIIASTCECDDGRFTFQPLSRHPCGTEKLLLARALAEDLGFRSEQIIAYGDSVHDAELLGWVGTPVAVRPGYRLAAMAQANGWEVLGRRLLTP